MKAASFRESRKDNLEFLFPASNCTVGEPFLGPTCERGLDPAKDAPQILLVTFDKLSNLTCVHCHVNAGPARKEILTRATIDRVIDWLAKTEIPTVVFFSVAATVFCASIFSRRLKVFPACPTATGQSEKTVAAKMRLKPID
jgi:hypothetical protein